MNSNVQQFIYALIIALAVLAVLVLEVKAEPKEEHEESQMLHRETRETSFGTESDNREFFRSLPCPQLFCRELHGCQRVEYIVWYRGNQPCRSCPFCMDYPGNGKKKRGLLINNVQQLTTVVCDRVQCPLVQEVSQGCTHPGTIDGYLRQFRCKSCPACFDSSEDLPQRGNY